MTISAVLEIQARIATIQQRFTPAAASAPSSGTATTSSAASGSFAGDLSTANEQFQSSGSVSSSNNIGQTATGATGSSDSGNAVVAIAKKYLGIPYVWGGTNPATGLDCSGLTDLVYKQVGVDLPRVSWEQAKAGQPVEGMANARPGDLLAFGQPVHHVAIYIGDGKMIEAPRPGKNVAISSVYETPSAIRRVLPEPATASYTAPQPAAATTPAGLASFAGPLPAGTPYAAEFQQAEARTGVPARVLAAVAKTESGFRPEAVSSSGARGLMQFMPATASGMGVNPLDPASAIDGAARLLKSHLKEFGSLPLSLAAYNAGQGNVRKYGGIPPFAETQNYVKKIMTSLNGSAT
jgi:cell wall-associated NlpC family hydrolase